MGGECESLKFGRRGQAAYRIIVAFAVALFLLCARPSWFGLPDAPGLGRTQAIGIVACTVCLITLAMGRLRISAWLERRVFHLILLLASFVGTCLGLELVLRFIPQGWIAAPRIVAVNQMPFAEATNGAVHYVPNQQIRMKLFAGWRNEYSVVIPSNNLGCVDVEDYYPIESSAGKRRIAFVGDSFTAGFHGGKPWISEMRSLDSKHEYAFYNLGVSGTGILDFNQRVDWFLESFEVDEIWFLVLTEDLRREDWTAEQCGDYICLNVGEKSHPLWYLPKHFDDNTTIIRVAYDKHGRWGALLYRACRSRLAEAVVFGRTQLRLPNYDLQMLSSRLTTVMNEARKKNAGLSLHFVHLPQSDEITRREYHLDVSKVVRDAGVEYHSTLGEIGWNAKDFYDFDGHPNQSGYSKLAKYMSNLIDESE